MKKYFLSGAMIITVALAGWNISKNNSENLLSDIAMENVEALADGEAANRNNGIWIVTYTISSSWYGSNITISCTTGGSYTC
ncbi:MAG: NVEALA domain-containing protein [Tannerellaceae bacterium]|jgi:hypothetical protein|nr:NVEALA domain-containing protein [Tannerellaceae bacterium]